MAFYKNGRAKDKFVRGSFFISFTLVTKQFHSILNPCFTPKRA